MRLKTGKHRHKLLFFALLLLVIIVSCENSTSRKAPADKSAVLSIENKEHFRQVVADAGDRLLMFEFYADWCPPCKQLAPIVEQVAKENREILDVYKINTDKNRALASDFRITGIPHVAFFKNKEIVMSLSGSYPKKMYSKVIRRLSSTAADIKPGRPNGT